MSTKTRFETTGFTFEDIHVSYRVGGAGYPLLLIHGSGPGASTIGNWRSVLEPLAQRYHVHAMDLIGFGGSDRKPQGPYFDFPLWLRQCRAMIEKMPGEKIGIIGHSISGALALKLAASEPRVGQVLTTGTMGAPYPLNDATVTCWTFPEDREALIAAARTLIADDTLIDETYLRNREAVLRMPGYGAYFGEMFSGDKQRFINATVLTQAEIDAIRCPLTMLHGRQDQGFPIEPLTMALSAKLPHADVHLLAGCSHSVAMERPEALLNAANHLFPHEISQAA
ncbi:alpha/beta fold hydrolase [Novosphingobium resinovorum]|uniref:Hydrolase n=1 Tax=Novosphingobium resinovorum TaxID=158500 RepID=A0A031JTR6_9SPHN|nr:MULTISPECIES: alpha/beta fold hydrolase [Novosphingobium]AOR80060.1 hydrolase [Novosphingobium resinovorum]EZP79762.1 Alpha/beta hydrolase fold protein [Novosphingobium resinovorum]MBF7014869.1 alpha/beta fold hydrolase [Novosphingobium sp. HR1a]WJM24654.1 alpha/beta fold hydrolase [Novosphingobium resinovorum]